MLPQSIAGRPASSATQDVASSPALHPVAARSFSRPQTAAVLAAGVLATLVLALQPILLGPLVGEGRLTLSEMGRTAMLESFGTAIAIAFSGARLRPHRLKLTVGVASLVAMGANVVAALGSHETIMLARVFAGLSAGLILWVWTGLLTTVALPARLVAIFVAAQSAGALLLSSLLSAFIIPRWGAGSGYAALAAVSVVNVLLASRVPDAYPAALASDGPRVRLPSARGFAGLLAVLLHLAAVLAVWVYALPLGRELGLPPGVVAAAVSIGIAAQIAGGVAGAVFARLGFRTALYLSIGGSLIGLGVIATAGGPLSFGAGLAIVSFFLMFAPGFQMPFLLEIDPTRGAGMQMITAQQFGFAAGPALVSLTVADGGVMPALPISAALFAGAALLVFATTAFGGRRPVV